MPAAYFIVRTTIALVLLALINLAQAVDINDVQTQIFTPTCAVAGCHNGAQSPNLRAGQAFTNIVNVPSSQAPSLFYIEPGNPGDSYLVRKIQGTGSGSQMPFGRSPLSGSLITLVRDWVLQGALEMEVADSDSDGITDTQDNCPNNANADQLNTDGDSEGDACDTDDDNDGVADTSDAFPLDAAESVDTDNDGLGNNADTDDDNDGVPDTQDAFPLDSTESVDTDGDGIGNNADIDDDDDGVADANDAFPLDSTESVDTDNDGVGDNSEVFPLEENVTAMSGTFYEQPILNAL